MIKVGFDIIDPTPTLPVGVTASRLASLKWDSSSGTVTTFKKALKQNLRTLQIGQCCYCRRQLFDDNTVEIEHFLEKSVVNSLRFEIQNLALSCKTCNLNKNSRFLKISKYLSRKATKSTGVKTQLSRCVALNGNYDPLQPLRVQKYRWVHPHFDSYSRHIDIHKNWIFKWKSNKGRSMIVGLRLNQIGQLERRALRERLANKTGIQFIVGALSESDKLETNEIIKLLIDRLKNKV